MIRALALFVAFVLDATTIGAQSRVAPAIPSTPAGRVLRAWLEANNSPDSSRLAAYYRRYQPGLPAGFEPVPRDSMRTYELLTVERSEPRRIEFTLRERGGSRTAYGMLAVSAAEPVRVTAFPLRALGTGTSPTSLHVDAATRSRVIAAAAAQLDTFYVLPEVARRVGDSLRTRLARRAYDAYENAMSFAMRVSEDLRTLTQDKHLRMEYLVPQPASSERSSDAASEVARMRAWMDDANCGFVRAERLAGNVGYLKLDMFAPPTLCDTTAAAAMTFLAGTRALIVDLRENLGGSPDMVAYLSSYLFAGRTHLNDLWSRHTGETTEFWTSDSVAGRRFGSEKPVYVLTSGHTFSAAEEFAYNLQSRKRAIVVGEATGGGAHPVWGRWLGDRFILGVPSARAVNPVTGRNWEGTGVQPDIRVPAAEALIVARRRIPPVRHR